MVTILERNPFWLKHDPLGRFETVYTDAHTTDRGSTCPYCSKTFEVEPRRGQQLSTRAARDRRLITEMCLPGTVSGEPDCLSWDPFYCFSLGRLPPSIKPTTRTANPAGSGTGLWPVVRSLP